MKCFNINPYLSDVADTRILRRRLQFDGRTWGPCEGRRRRLSAMYNSSLSRRGYWFTDVLEWFQTEKSWRIRWRMLFENVLTKNEKIPVVFRRLVLWWKWCLGSGWNFRDLSTMFDKLWRLQNCLDVYWVEINSRKGKSNDCADCVALQCCSCIKKPPQ